VSVQSFETDPPARGKNQTIFKNKATSACCMDVKHNKRLINFVYQQKSVK
jgi:hypothetical protein